MPVTCPRHVYRGERTSVENVLKGISEEIEIHCSHGAEPMPVSCWEARLMGCPWSSSESTIPGNFTESHNICALVPAEE